ncbi:uncharacterized protein [Sinocyclocheilus grahami]|uniref:uncharacterized protein n=1 Tax=Sinocyclocheilus grahami TaxID=75366 RepID=UPI0007ACFE07|nr:PREDICTED: uncharacterized protein LOC107577990 [Sinocyclocheilus grahami]
MADWKMPVNYNFNPSYHAYAYGLVYPQVSEHGHPNLSWAEAAYTHSGGVTATYYSAQTAQQSPPWSPENGSVGAYGHYTSHAQNGRLFLSYSKTESDPKPKDAEQAGSDTPSDTEAHTPDPYSNPQVREPVFKRSPPQTPFYSSYPQPRSPTQATARPPGNWPVPPAVAHYEFPSPASYMQALDGSNAANKEGSPTPSMPSATQWTAKGMTLL